MNEKKKIPESLKTYRKYALRFQYLIIVSVMTLFIILAVLFLVVQWPFLTWYVALLLIFMISIPIVFIIIATVWYFGAVYKLRL